MEKLNNIDKQVSQNLKRIVKEKEDTLRLSKDKTFDYVEEGKICEECGGYKGGEMIEGYMCECGRMEERDMYEDYSKGQKYIAKQAKPYNKIGAEDFRVLRSKKKKNMNEISDEFDYEMQEPCPHCNGTGYDEFDDVECEWCDGTGEYDEYGDLKISDDMPPYKTKYRMPRPGLSDLEESECVECGSMEEGETEEGNAFTGMLKKTPKGRSFKLGGKEYKDRSSLEEKWNKEVDVKQTGEYSDMSIEELNAAIKKQKAKNDKTMESGKKVSHADKTKMSQLYFAKRAKQGWKGKGKAKVEEARYRIVSNGESAIFTENEVIDMIENIVNEEKTKNNIKNQTVPKGYTEYERVHKQDKKEEDQYFKDLAKKMTDYLKDSSDKGSKYEMKETQKFPTENGGMEKGNRKKYTPSDAVDEYIDAFSYPGMTNLVYDEIKPNDEWIEANMKGSSKTGNAQVDEDGNALGNVVPSKTGDKFFKNYQDNLYGQEQQEASYKRQPQPVDQAGEHTERGSLKSKRGKKTAQSVLNKLEESVTPKEKEKLSEEFSRMQQLMGYNHKTQ